MENQSKLRNILEQRALGFMRQVPDGENVFRKEGRYDKCDYFNLKAENGRYVSMLIDLDEWHGYNRFNVEFDPNCENRIVKARWYFGSTGNWTTIEGNWETGVFTKEVEGYNDKVISFETEHDSRPSIMPPMKDLPPLRPVPKKKNAALYGIGAAVGLLAIATALVHCSQIDDKNVEQLSEQLVSYEQVSGKKLPLKAHKQMEFLKNCASSIGGQADILAHMLDDFKKQLPSDKRNWNAQQREAYDWVIESYVESKRYPSHDLKAVTEKELRALFTPNRVTTQNAALLQCNAERGRDKTGN